MINVIAKRIYSAKVGHLHYNSANDYNLNQSLLIVPWYIKRSIKKQKLPKSKL